MGAGFAELFLDRERSGGQIVSHSGRGIHADTQLEPQTENLDAAGSAKSRCQTRAGGEENARVVSVKDSLLLRPRWPALVWCCYVEPVDLPVCPGGHDFPRSHGDVPIHPRIVAPFAMADVGQDF